eukprot:s1274_g18.t1
MASRLNLEVAWGAVLPFVCMRPDWGSVANAARHLSTLVRSDVVYQSVRRKWLEDNDPEMQGIMRLVESEERRRRREARDGWGTPSSSDGP